MPAPEPRSAEAWATFCHKESHWIAWSAGQGGAEKILCINCARAYAREVGEAAREEAATLFEEKACGYGLSIEVEEEVAAAIRQIGGTTP